ncbi:MAG: 2-octaprenylphenol hydroxylase [Methylophagaceae bacterium]|jgi:2-octaprenylphenol hydroxylase
MSQHYDVIIVGAGMVGSSLAVALSTEKKLKIALIEPVELKPIAESDPADMRVSAVSQASEQLLKNLNIWPHFIQSRLSPFTDMIVWETQSSKVHFNSADIGEPHLGHLVENRHIQQACLSECQQQSNITLICPDKPASKNGNAITLENGQTLTADLIIAADGAQSPLRDWAGIDSKGWDYHQHGLVCTVTTQHPHQQTARQRFLPEGPLAFLPLANSHQCSIVWSNSSEQAELLKKLSDDEFKDTIAKAFEHQLGDIVELSSRVSFPLKCRHADHYVESGFALVGDAAHTIHPLAGQGVNIGFLDAATLAEVVIQAHQKGRKIGSLHTLNKYQRQRKGDNLTIQLTMDVFKRVFGSHNPAVRLARQSGFKLVNNNDFLRRCFMQQASGQRFANPSLTKPKF